MRLFNALPTFAFSAGEIMGDKYLETRYMRVFSQVAKQLKNLELRKLGNIRKVPKLARK